MNLTINGKAVSTEQTLLSHIIAEFGATPPFALAVNGEFVAQADYDAFEVKEDDLVDIVSPIFGG